jgi:hypothetical protein
MQAWIREIIMIIITMIIMIIIMIIIMMFNGDDNIYAFILVVNS